MFRVLSALILVIIAQTVIAGSPSEALQAIEDQWNAAAAKWEPEKFVPIYTEDALFYGGRPDLYVGSTGVRDYFASYTAVLSSVQIKFVNQHFIELGPDAFVAQGAANIHLRTASGKDGDIVNRTTLVIAKRGDRWVIASHHFSDKPAAPPIPK